MEIQLPSLQDVLAFLHFIFSNGVPPDISPGIWIPIKYGALVLVILLIGQKFLSVSADIIDICKHRLLSAFSNEQAKERSKQRRLFAMYLEHEINRVSVQEDWKDYRFTDLEVEVEAEGKRRASGFIAFLQSSQSGLRHEKSLSRAIGASTEKVILLEGEPGAGKSVALRHVALKVAAHAKRVGGTKSILPIYINLKLLERDEGKEINQDLIESFILTTIKRSNDRDIEQFLENEFQIGMQEGTFLFLFDSFDELPEILNSTEVDDKVNEYGRAIDDFLHGMSKCHGVIASRFYKGPNRFDWARFRILPLSEKRQMQLIRKTRLDSRTQQELVGQLGNASQAIHSMASNPFFLSLLCKHRERGHPFPDNAHSVFETYINQRFIDDEKYVQKRFKLDTSNIRIYAEAIAFCMTTGSNLGLSPAHSDLENALTSLSLDTSSFETALDALEYMKLARADIATNTEQSRSFTFSHRRFQEYFATCFLLHNPKRISAKDLLT